MQRRVRSTLLGATAVALAAGSAPFALTGAQAETSEPEAAEEIALAIPEPAGEFDTGTTALHLIDQDRADVWVPEERRELMVSLWYPTDEDGPAAPYMTAEESELFMEQLDPELPGDLLATVETNSVVDAEPLGGERPLVMLSPGFSGPRSPA